MNTNIAAWMIAGGPRSEFHATQREHEQLYAFRESQRFEGVSLIDRLRGISRPRRVESDRVSCPA
jgi:hypothetical protein